MISSRMANLLSIALPLLVLVGCASQSPQVTQDPKAELCTNLARFNTAVATLKSMSPSSTVGDFRSAREQVQTTYAAVKESASNVQDARATELERAYQALDQSLQTISDSSTLSQAAASIAPQVAAVEAARTQMQAGLNCP